MRVSAVVATYNRADIIARAISSALKQDHEDLEVVVVDDGSTDATAEVLAKFGSRIRIIRQPNRERGAARNAGVNAATGELIAFLDSDDEWHRGHVRLVANAMERRGAGVGYSFAEIVDDETGEMFRSPRRPIEGTAFRRLLIENVVPFSTSVVRRDAFEAVGGFGEDRVLCRGGEDWDLWMRLSERCPFAFVPQITARIHRHPGATTADVTRQMYGVRAAARRAVNLGRVRREGLAHRPRIGVVLRASRLHRERGHLRAAAASIARLLVREPRAMATREVWEQAAAIARAALRSTDAASRARQNASDTLLWVAWSRVAGRPQDLARDIGGDAVVIHPSVPGGVLGRYIASMAATAVTVVRRRPSVVVCTNPPIFAALTCWLVSRVFGTAVVLDSHPGGFGLAHDPVGRVTQPLHRWLARRSAAVLVTTEALAEKVAEWGVPALVVHEPPPSGPVAASRRGHVLVGSVFGRDEPMDVIRDAASKLSMDVIVTGDPAKQSRLKWSDNVKLTGFVRLEQFLSLLAGAEVAVVVTDEQEAVSRSGWEAIHLGVPLVVSDTPATRRYFPHARHVDNTASDIVRAVDEWRAMPATKREERVRAAREDAIRRWQEQRHQLVEVLQKHVSQVRS